MFVVTALRGPAVPSYLATVIVSQLLSPILWDHYALLLLLPVAWLVDRGHWWAVAFVLVTPIFLADLRPRLDLPARRSGPASRRSSSSAGAIPDPRPAPATAPGTPP